MVPNLELSNSQNRTNLMRISLGCNSKQSSTKGLSHFNIVISQTSEHFETQNFF